MSEHIVRSSIETESSYAREGGLGRVTLLQELAEPVEFLSIDRSNRSTPPANTDFDDQ